MDAVIRIASIVAGEDFATERARTMDKMGLSGLQHGRDASASRIAVTDDAARLSRSLRVRRLG